MIEPAIAWERLELFLEPLPAEVFARRAALGRILAEDLSATVDVPASDVSAMDGYALAGEIEPGARIPVAGVIAAGDAPGFELPPDHAVRIMTGATVPAAADRVIQVEHTDGGEREVLVEKPPARGDHIRRRAEILHRGDPLLPRNTFLTPGGLSLLATHGIDEVPVYGSPQVAYLVTGDEVVPPDREPAPGELRDSHSDFLLAAGSELGLELHSLGIAPDRAAEIRARVRSGLDHDVLLLCGGVSMGEFDLVEEVLRDLGCRILFDSVAIQPGKPLVAAVRREPNRCLVFGLPGNPGSVMVCFWNFVRPALRRLMGIHDAYGHGLVQGRLEAPLPGAKGRDRYVAAEVRYKGGEALVTPFPPKGSHDVVAYAHGCALVRIPAGSEPAPAGSRCEVLPLLPGPAGGS